MSQETQVPPLSQEDPPEKEIATHSSILVWKIPWTEEPRRLSSRGHKELDTTEQVNHHHHHQDHGAKKHSHVLRY